MTNPVAKYIGEGFYSVCENSTGPDFQDILSQQLLERTQTLSIVRVSIVVKNFGICKFREILNAVMDINPSDPIGGCENTLSFPSEETSLDFGLSSHLSMRDVPCPSSPPYGFLHHTIGALNNELCIYVITEVRMPAASFPN
jgi:hypothetical protein